MTELAVPAAEPLTGPGRLAERDPVLAAALRREQRYQGRTLAMVASSSAAHPSVREALSSAVTNVTAEGYPGRRFHPGAAHFDEVENLAVERARRLFGVPAANVQPHSCSAANLAVLTSLLPVGGRLLSLGLDDGGHLSHGSRASVTGSLFEVGHYGLRDDGWIDLAHVRERALAFRPQVLLAGASAYPRQLDFAGFRAVADEVGAHLVADVSHIAGLIAAGVHPSPVGHAHVITTSTYKQLMGPRGGLILLGDDGVVTGPDGPTTWRRLIDRGVFPRTQGTPDPAAIAAKAAALGEAATPAFRRTAVRIRDLAATLAETLSGLGWPVLTGGTDTHMVLLDLRPRGLTGVVAERALEECGILANRNRISGDPMPPLVGSGLRLGTNVLAQRGLDAAAVRRCGYLVDRVLTCLRPLSDTGYLLDPRVRRCVAREVCDIVAAHPLDGPGPP